MLSPSALSAPSGLVSLFLTYFRNYKHLRLALDARNVLLTGPNGAGKTSLLEAISLLSPSKGLRQAALSDLRTTNAPALSSWSLSAQIQTPEGETLDLGTGEEPPRTQITERRVAKIHHKNTKSLAAFEEVLWILWLTPAMDRLFSEAPQKRRAFFDHLANGLFPRHKGHWAQYKILLKERFRLLSFSTTDASWLEAVEEKLARLGAQITRTRREFLDLLMAILPQIPTSFPVPTLALRETYATEKEESLETSLRAALEAHRKQDAQTGNTAAGPHRTEWEVRFSAKGLLASSCSTGEQKALLITLIIAAAYLYKARRSGIPLLLFDDCAAHLDAGRQEALWIALLHLRIQTWLTSVTPPHFPATEATLQHFSLENGLCTPSRI